MNKFQQFIADSLAFNGWTPDIPRLENQLSWYVFVYNSRRGKSSAYFTHTDSECSFRGIGWTKSSIYNILNIETSKAQYQLAHPSGTDRILGEIWEVPTSYIPDLDSDELNQLVSHRLLVPIEGPRGQVYPCWMYITDKNFLMKGGVRISKYVKYTWYGTDKKFLEIT